MKLLPQLSATARIVLGLVGLLVSAMLMVGMLGLFPDQKAEIIRRRTAFCESAAISFSLMADKSDHATMQVFLESLAKRNPEMRSLAIRREQGELLFEIGAHGREWNSLAQKQSDGSQVWVQLFSGGKPWGSFEATFEPVTARLGVLAGWLGSPSLAYGVVLALLCAVVFYGYLRSVLRQLNPSKAVPKRVREALDTLAEGLLLLDNQQRVVLANRAFGEATGIAADTLIGSSLDRLPLVSCEDSPSTVLPWKEVHNTGGAVRGTLLGMQGPANEALTFSVSASPVFDEQGKQRGVLASFENVTQLARKKRELGELVDHLQLAGEAIQKQNRELERLATRDPLTGCLNRRSFFEHFETEWRGALRYNTPLSAVMVDVDHFKSINDTHGHSEGDNVLRAVAECLQQVARETDIVARYGGEEFAVLMPHTNLDDAEKAAERLRQGIAELALGKVRVTASLGVSAMDHGARDAQELLNQADQCLYAAKRNGRNQVVRWDAVPHTQPQAEQSKLAAASAAPEAAPHIPYQAVAALMSALAYRDQSTAEHSRRVADWCLATAKGVLSHSDSYILEIAALLHDIGKIGIPDSILLKPSRLTPDEWKLMRRNELIGKEIIRSSFNTPELTQIVECYQAHYRPAQPRPAVPAGNAIPVGARILAIADAYDAMVTDQVYRPARTPRQAIAELRRCAGTQFDGELVERFIAVVETRLEHTTNEGSTVSPETALALGLQMERLSRAIHDRDVESLEALSHRMLTTATRYGVAEVASRAQKLTHDIDSNCDALAVLHAAGELLEACRTAQSAHLASPERAPAPLPDSGNAGADMSRTMVLPTR